MIVNFCAHSGIELIGVSRPLNNINGDGTFRFQSA